MDFVQKVAAIAQQHTIDQHLTLSVTALDVLVILHSPEGTLPEHCQEIAKEINDIGPE